MSETVRRRLRLAALLLGVLLLLPGPALAGAPEDLESDIKVPIGGVTKTLTLSDAMQALNISSVSIALIDQDRIAFARAYGQSVTPDTLFQAASLSKFVAAVGAMRLVDQKRLALGEDVNTSLTSWHVPANVLLKDHIVTLRGLLSMTAGIGVAGFLGYELGAPLPTLTQILDGTPPANSAPVTVIDMPGRAYHYSGGSFEIAEALMVDTLRMPFVEAMDDLVLKPAEMSHSTFAQPLPEAFRAKAVTGHLGDGTEVKGGFHVFPEHAAAGLWSTPTDIANLLLLIGRAWRGESALFLRPETAREMLKAQNGGPYGLGAAIAESGGALIVMKRGQNIGYQSYLIFIPGEGQGMVVMTNSDNGSILAEALIRRVTEIHGWPALPAFAD
jgi:CubicO group peptidase (beta-lactamase class C family)